MPSDGKVIIDTELNPDGATQGLEKAKSTWGKNFANFGKTLGKGLVTALGAVSAGITALGKNAIQYNASMEQYQTSFEVMTGSAEKAADLMGKLKTLGAETPFEFTDLADATQTLMAFGFSAEEAYDQFKILGDISQGNAQKLETVTRAWGKMSSAQKVSLEDINMMIDSGFNPLQVISQKTGESMQSLYDRISKGTMSVDEIAQAMKDATSEGGQFYQSMEKQSQTLEGRISTLKDNFQQLTGEIFQGATDSSKSVINLAISWVDELSKAFEENGVQGLVSALGDILAQAVSKAVEFAPTLIELAISILTEFATGLENNADIITGGLTDLANVLISGVGNLAPQLLNTMLVIIANLIQQIGAMAPQFVVTITKLITDLVNVIVKNIPLIIKAGVSLIKGLVQGILQAIPVLVEAIPEIITNLVDGLLECIPDIIEAGIELFSALVDALPQIIDSIVQAIPKIIDGIVTALQTNLPKIMDAGIQLFSALIKDLPKIIQTITSALPKIITAITQAFTKAIPTLIQTGVTLLTALIDNLPQIIETIVEVLPEIIDSIVNTLLNNIDSIIDAGVTLLSALIDNIPDIITKIAEKIPDLIKGIVDTLLKHGPDIIEGGIKLFAKIVGDVPKIIAKIAEKIPSIITGIINTFISFAQSFISLGKSIGTYIANGIKEIVKTALEWVGIETETVAKKLDPSLQGIYSNASKQTSKIISPTASTARHYATGGLLGSAYRPNETVLNFYDVQTDPDAIYQKFYNNATYGMALSY